MILPDWQSGLKRRGSGLRRRDSPYDKKSVYVDVSDKGNAMMVSSVFRWKGIL